MMEQREIRAYLEAQQAELLEMLGRFVRIPSVSSDRIRVKEALHFALDLGKSMGFQADSLLDDQVGVIEIGEGEEVLGILSHVDVVSPGNRDAWRTDPFEPILADGCLFGRGTLDDKGAIIACLYAMKAAAQSGQVFHKRVRLILGTQEEVDWSDMRAYVNAYPPPDYGFTPDGEFPLCNIEKGSLDVDLLFPLGAPPDQEGRSYLTGIEAGVAHNVVPGDCTARVTTQTADAPATGIIRACGKAVHSCQPEKGDNAIFELAKILRKQNLTSNRLLELLLMVEDRFRDLYGSALGLYSETEYYNGEFVHRNVFSPTQMRVAENELQVHINVRFGYGTDPDEILRKLASLAEEYGGRAARAAVLPAVYVSKDRPFLRTFAEAYEEATGLKNEFVLAYGGSYAKAMPNIVSWGPIFPGEADTCHEANEFISVKSLMENTAIFTAAISKIVFSKDSFR